MGNVGDNLKAGDANWTFGGNVAENFDGHIGKSVPFYKEGHDLVCSLSDYFIKDNSIIYELGSSTGELVIKLATHHNQKNQVKIYGLEIEEEMIVKSEKKKLESKVLNVEFLQSDILTFPYEKSDLIVAYYTLQFIRPSIRQELINKIYESLNWGGAFILFEKVRGSDARFQDILTGLYNDFKLRQGFSAEEIINKSKSLKGVLEPFSTQGNFDLLKRSGFVDIMSVMKYLCFEGIIAIK